MSIFDYKNKKDKDNLMKNLKKILLCGIFIFSYSNIYANFSFVPGHVMLGVSIGGGGSEYVYGSTGAAINISTEVILDTWDISRVVEMSVGFLGNGSVFFAENLAQGGLSLMPTYHISFYETVDWYLGVGFGISMHKNLVLYGVGLSTGFNIEVREWFLVNLGFELQGPQVFGAIGVKFRFEIVR